jgi:hypothetical protein
MDFLGKVIAQWHLSEQGYIVAFDVSCPASGAEDGPIFKFNLAGFRFRNGRAVHAVVGELRSWWHTSAYLTPSVVRTHLLPSLSETMSDAAIQSFRNFYSLGAIPVEKILFFSHASPEKSTEAEEMLRQEGIETVYLERVAADLIHLPSHRAVHPDPLVMQVIGLLRGAFRIATEKAKEEGTGEKSQKAQVVISPQMSLNLFQEAPEPKKK